MNIQNNEPVQRSQNIWAIVIIVIATALIIGGGIYIWQNLKIKLAVNKLSICVNNSYISNLKNNGSTTADNSIKAVSIKKSGDMNYFIYTDENGRETIIDKAPWNRNDWLKLEQSNKIKNITEIIPFLNAEFSPLENYILLTRSIWEGGDIINLYDIANKKTIDGIYGTTALEFTPDEKYIISCDSGRSFPTAKIYETSGFKEIYNVFGEIIGEGETQFHNGYRVMACNWDAKNKRVRFYLENFTIPVELKEVFFEIDKETSSESGQLK